VKDVKLASAPDFWQGCDASYAGGYSEAAVFSARFDANDGSLTANPTLLAVSELSWEHEHHLQFASYQNFGIGVQEDAAHT